MYIRLYKHFLKLKKYVIELRMFSSMRVVEVCMFSHPWHSQHTFLKNQDSDCVVGGCA